jgi:preprotein translocase subunit Sec61beta
LRFGGHEMGRKRRKEKRMTPVLEKAGVIAFGEE